MQQTNISRARNIPLLQILLQVKMLQALGMKSTLITDGKSPINLFTTANGLVGGGILARRTKRDNVSEDDDD